MGEIMAESRSLPATAGQTARSPAPRWFGQRQLLRLLGKSERTMAWLVAARGGDEQMLVLPRLQPASASERQAWADEVRQAARLQHPNLAPVLEIGLQDGWPFAIHALEGRATLADRLGRQGLPAGDAALLAIQALQGLAYAHEAGVAHHDVQSHLLLVDDDGCLQIAGVAIGCLVAAARSREADQGSSRYTPLSPTDPLSLRRTRAAAERDVLALGVIWHRVLTGQSALDETDAGLVIERMPPQGREVVRLPWAGTQPIPEALRTIFNRATDRQERQRYRSARTLARALDGWWQSEQNASGGPLGLLGDRLRHAGVLPAAPGNAERALQVVAMDRKRTHDLAEFILEDLALAFEMLRLVNAAIGRSALASGGAVLTVRRAIAMLGVEAVRSASQGLRRWPGPLDEPAAAELALLINRSKRAARLALLLRPAAYDAEVTYLVTLMHNLGRLVVQYHFADDAQQIRRLMQSGAPAREGEPEEPGMSEEAASHAVLGVDSEAIGLAVARQWGLDEGVLAMTRRLRLETPVRTPEGDAAMLRTVASCAHEALDASQLPAAKVTAALQRVVQRYSRILEFTLRDLQDAIKASAQPPAWGHTQPAPLERDSGRDSVVGAFASTGAQTRF